MAAFLARPCILFASAVAPTLAAFWIWAVTPHQTVTLQSFQPPLWYLKSWSSAADTVQHTSMMESDPRLAARHGAGLCRPGVTFWSRTDSIYRIRLKIYQPMGCRNARLPCCSNTHAGVVCGCLFAPQTLAAVVRPCPYHNMLREMAFSPRCYRHAAVLHDRQAEIAALPLSSVKTDLLGGTESRCRRLLPHVAPHGSTRRSAGFWLVSSKAPASLTHVPAS